MHTPTHTHTPTPTHTHTSLFQFYHPVFPAMSLVKQCKKLSWRGVGNVGKISTGQIEFVLAFPNKVLK